jgi:hypothetical protein
MLDHGLSNVSVTRGGFEYDLALIDTAAGLMLGGPRQISALPALRTAASRPGRARSRRCSPG